MKQAHTLEIKEIIDSEFAVDADNAEMVYKLVFDAIKQKKNIDISFKNIDVLITAFLNIMYGKLFKDYTEEEIDRYINFINLKESWEEMIPMIKKRALMFYKSK